MPQSQLSTSVVTFHNKGSGSDSAVTEQRVFVYLYDCYLRSSREANEVSNVPLYVDITNWIQCSAGSTLPRKVRYSISIFNVDLH